MWLSLNRITIFHWLKIVAVFWIISVFFGTFSKMWFLLPMSETFHKWLRNHFYVHRKGRIRPYRTCFIDFFFFVLHSVWKVCVTESNRVLWYYLSQALTKLLSLPSSHIAPLPRGSASKRPTNSQWGRWELFLICVNVKQVWTRWTLTNERQRPGKRGTFYSAGSTKLLSSAEAYFLLNGFFMITLISDHTLEGEWNVWSHDSCMDNPLIYSKAKGRLGLFMLIPSVLVLVQDLADDLSSELSGNFRSVVLGLLMLAPVYDAHELRNAMKVLLNSLY